MLRINAKGCSVKGLREVQQDRFGFIVHDDKAALVVADGNGGAGGGELAEVAVKSALAELSFRFSNRISIDSEKSLESLGIETLNLTANRVMWVKNSFDEWEGAGSTITCIIITPSLVGTFWIGDSPAAIYQSGILTRLTWPVHTLAEMLIEQGQSREELENQPRLNSILTRCLGHDSAEPSSKIVRVTGEALVMAGSDGVFGYLKDKDLSAMLQPGFSEALSEEIVNQSLNNGSDDNCTILTGLITPLPAADARRVTMLYEWK